MNNLNIYCVIDGKHLGDDGNAIGIAQSLNAHYLSEQSAVSLQMVSLAQLPEYFDPTQTHLVIAAGAHHLPGLIDFSHTHGHLDAVTTLWSSHQTCDMLPSALNSIDFLALPRHAITPSLHADCAQSRTTLISTLGVAHNVSLMQLDQQASEWLDKIPRHLGYLVVVLGGDAPAGDQQPQLFTTEYAYRLGQHTAQIAQEKNLHLLVTNGPRTGQHNPVSFAPLPVHQLNSKLDLVTQAYLSGTEHTSQGSDSLLSLYNFTFGQPSAFLALLGTARQHANSLYYLPGESTSMISQAVDLLTHNSLVVYDTPAMNPQHSAFVDDICCTSPSICRLSPSLTRHLPPPCRGICVNFSNPSCCRSYCPVIVIPTGKSSFF